MNLQTFEAIMLRWLQIALNCCTVVTMALHRQRQRSYVEDVFV